jgi:hypothetical protein
MDLLILCLNTSGKQIPVLKHARLGGKKRLHMINESYMEAMAY